ncbi:MAG: DUF2062 domain-containing protein [Lentisphaerae bacterium]|nr:MAG: DUF2062 domain-containing protein [Lentisphaerota bacterium]
MVSRPIRYFYLQIIRQKGTPENIAAGMAVGVFIGLFIPIFQIIVALIIAAFLKLNKITAFLGTWVSNPFTFPIIIPFYFFLGQYLTGIESIRRVQITRKETGTYLLVTPWKPHRRLHIPFRKSSNVKKGSSPLQPPVPYEVRLSPLPLAKFLWRKGSDLVLIWFAAATPCSILGAILAYQITLIVVRLYRKRKEKQKQERTLFWKNILSPNMLTDEEKQAKTFENTDGTEKVSDIEKVGSATANNCENGEE